MEAPRPSSGCGILRPAMRGLFDERDAVIMVGLATSIVSVRMLQAKQ
jgi:hypothetical protein